MFEEVVIVEDLAPLAQQLKEGLASRDVNAKVFHSVKEAEPYLRTRHELGFFAVVDINFGIEEPRAGLDLIRTLHSMRPKEDCRFFILALTTYGSLEQDALTAGADQFLEKIRPKVDSLEIALRFYSQRSEEARQRARSNHEALVTVEYADLEETLQDGGHEANVKSLDLVRRSLNRPFLARNERLILVAIEQALVSQRAPNAEVMTLLRDGVSHLRDPKGAGDDDMAWWVRRASEIRAPVVRAFVQDEYFEVDDES